MIQRRGVAANSPPGRHDPQSSSTFINEYATNYIGNMESIWAALYNIPWLTGPYFIEKLQKIDTVGTITHTVYENVLKSRRIDLSEHHLYGSSRLGVKEYLPGQHYIKWDYTTTPATADTVTLLNRRPWYSLEFNDDISGLASTYPYGMTDVSTFQAGHVVGQKQYELTNHLGNVQATVSDLPSYHEAGTGDTIRQHFTSIVTAYDYYPFGMLMPGRGTDSILAISNTQGNILIEATDFSDGTKQGWLDYFTPDVTVENGRLRMHATQRWQGTHRFINLVPGKQYRIKFDVDRGNTTGAYFSVWNNGNRPVWEYFTQNGPVSYTFTASVAATEFRIETDDWTPAGDYTYYIDNYVLEEMKPTTEVPPATNGGCITMTQPKWVTTWETKCYDVYQWVWPYYEVFNGGTASIDGNMIAISAPNAGDGIGFMMDAVPDLQQTVSLDVAELTGTGTLQVEEEINGNWVNLGATAINHLDHVSLNFTPTKPQVKIRILGPVYIKTHQNCITIPVLKQENVLVTICPDDNDKYRFGYNDKEKVNEWAGIGNYLDYGARGLDSRTGRLPYTIDPLFKQYPSLTPYQYAGNNPIQNVDVDGLEGADGNAVQTATRKGVTIIGQQTARETGKLSINSAGQLVEKTPLWKKALPWVGKAAGTIVYVFMPVENAKPNYEFRAQLKKIVDERERIYEAYKVYSQRIGRNVEPETEKGPDRKITLYRGVHAKHPALPSAVIGMAVPMGGDATPLEHNWGNYESEYTSWSVDKTVAEFHGMKQGEGGVVLTKEFKLSELTPSPDKYSEGEVLVKGVVTGAKVEPAKDPGNQKTDISTKQ